MTVIDNLSEAFQKPRGWPLIQECLKWVIVFGMIGGFVYLNTWLTDTYPFMLVVIPIVTTFIGIEIGYRSTKGYWLGESPEDLASAQYQKTVEEIERIRGNERAYQVGRRLGNKLKGK